MGFAPAIAHAAAAEQEGARKSTKDGATPKEKAAARRQPLAEGNRRSFVLDDLARWVPQFIPPISDYQPPSLSCAAEPEARAHDRAGGGKWSAGDSNPRPLG